jgi:hypothetical protein
MSLDSVLWYCIGILFGIAIGGGFVCDDANAANMPDPRIDVAATGIASKPIRAHCEGDEAVWANMAGEAFPGVNPFQIAGYTFLQTPVIYIAPRVCRPLHDALQHGVEEAGVSPLGLALSTLAHESVHQRGIVNEAVTECLARKEVRDLAVGFLRIPETAPFLKRVIVKKRIKVGGRWFTIKVPKLVTAQKPNPLLAKVLTWARVWSLSKPPAYQGGVC